MVGDGPDRIDAEAEARDLGVQDRVFFLGKIDAVAPLLAGADLFLLPSESESFGLSALEALASGVPVIGTDAGWTSRSRSRRRDRRPLPRRRHRRNGPSGNRRFCPTATAGTR